MTRWHKRAWAGSLKVMNRKNEWMAARRHVAGPSTVTALGLEVSEEVADERRVEILERELAWRFVKPLRREAQQEAEAVPVPGDGVGARMPLCEQAVSEERLKMRGEDAVLHRHTSSPERSSLSSGGSRGRTRRWSPCRIRTLDNGHAQGVAALSFAAGGSDPRRSRSQPTTLPDPVTAILAESASRSLGGAETGEPCFARPHGRIATPTELDHSITTSKVTVHGGGPCSALRAPQGAPDGQRVGGRSDGAARPWRRA